MNGTQTGALEWKPADPEEFRGRRTLVVGGTNGIGRALAKALAARGARVTVVGRTFRDEGHRGLSFVEADLSSLAKARELGATLEAERLDLVIFTTGVFPSPRREQTAEGIERDLATSYLSRFVILRQLGARLGRESPRRARVFVMGFPGTGQRGDVVDPNAERAYKPMTSHWNTVAGNEALVLDAARRYPHIDTFGLNPGLIKTDIRGSMLGGAGSLRHRLVEWLIGLFTPSAETYAERIVPLLGAAELEHRSGALFNKTGAAIAPSEGFDRAWVEQWMEVSEALVSRALPGDDRRPSSGAPA